MSKILIVDDEKDMAEMIGGVLELKGYQTKAVFNGYGAIEEVKQTHYDLILMDIKLPDINGVETFLKIKEIDFSVKVIMMTGFSVEDLITEALKQGAYACLHKPFDMEKAISKVEEVLRQSQKVILIVEDDLATRENLGGILKERGYKVCEDEDGEEAIAKLKESKYDCLLLDLKLPKIDGISVLREAKKIYPEVIVIVMTGYDLPQMLEEAERLSAYACLKKPIDPEELVKLLKEAGL